MMSAYKKIVQQLFKVIYSKGTTLNSKSIWFPSIRFMYKPITLNHTNFWRCSYPRTAFDRVWHEGIVYKLNSIGISDKFYKLIESYLSNRFQRVVLNGQTSLWRPILAGLPQGSILGLPRKHSTLIERWYMLK